MYYVDYESYLLNLVGKVTLYIYIYIYIYIHIYIDRCIYI